VIKCQQKIFKKKTINKHSDKMHALRVERVQTYSQIVDVSDQINDLVLENFDLQKKMQNFGRLKKGLENNNAVR
jgi:hypothetical protein